MRTKVALPALVGRRRSGSNDAVPRFSMCHSGNDVPVAALQDSAD
jgi:hypothetical protein